MSGRFLFLPFQRSRHGQQFKINSERGKIGGGVAVDEHQEFIGHFYKSKMKKFFLITVVLAYICTYVYTASILGE